MHGHSTRCAGEPRCQSWRARGESEDVRWGGAGTLSSKHLWDPSTSLMCRSLGYWLPPQPTPQHFSTRALTSPLSSPPPSLPPPSLLPRSSCPLPFIFSLLCLGVFPPSHSAHSISSRAFFIPFLPIPPPLPSLITLQRLVINASFNCHAHFYAH